MTATRPPHSLISRSTSSTLGAGPELRPRDAAGTLVLGLGQAEPAGGVRRDRHGFLGGVASGGEQRPRAVTDKGC